MSHDLEEPKVTKKVKRVQGASEADGATAKPKKNQFVKKQNGEIADEPEVAVDSNIKRYIKNK